ncbi:PQQ-binding-like beta-propeller repeat protein [bacterium]|nr:PQQ-binding-like beta-propeller repeat protein [bacterium]
MAFAPQLYSQWMGLYHDKQHSSRTALVAPDYPDSLIDWKFKTNDQVIATPVVGPSEYYYDDNGNGIYDPHETYEDANGNGRWDDGEMFDDVNNNLQYDHGEDFLDYNGNRRFDPGFLIAGSWDNTLYAINILRDENENSRVYWKYVLNDRITASPTLGPGEYYFDRNKNGQYDPDENYIDENQNGIRDRNTIYVPCLDGTIYAFYSERADEGNVDWDGNGNKGDQVRLRWIFHVGSPIVSSCVVDVGEPFVDSNGNGVYDVGELFTDIYLNGVRDGSLEEPFEDLNSNGRYDAYLNEPFTDYNKNKIRDGITIYFVAFDGRLYALNEDGSLKWSTLLGKEGIPIDTTPAISLNGERIFITSPDRSIYAVDASGQDGIQGRVVWSYRTNGYISTSPAVASDNSVIFGTGYPDNKLYCLTYDGTLKFAPVDVKGWVHSSPAIGADGTIYITVADYKPFYNEPMSRLVAVSGQGEILWTDSYAMPGQEVETWLFSSPTIDNNGLIYFLTSSNQVYAIYPTGELKWWVKLVGDAQSPPATTSAYWLRSTPIIGPDESFFAGSTDSYIYGLGKDIVRPNTVEPTIWAAGFGHGPISTRTTQLTMDAIIWDPEGNISKVEVYDPTKPGTPVIGEMTRMSNGTEENSYNYQLVWDIPSGYFTPSEYIFFIKAFDAAGHESDTWPRLTIHKATSGGGSTIPGTAALIMSPFMNQELLEGVTPLSISDDSHASSPQGNSPPEINLAGFYKTFMDTRNGGTLQILAYVKDPDGVSDISKVEISFLYYGFTSTIDITNLATQLSATENKYLFESTIGAGAPGGDYFFYLIAYDRQGNTTTWPYLKVN